MSFFVLGPCSVAWISHRLAEPVTWVRIPAGAYRNPLLDNFKYSNQLPELCNIGKKGFFPENFAKDAPHSSKMVFVP